MSKQLRKSLSSVSLKKFKSKKESDGGRSVTTKPTNEFVTVFKSNFVGENLPQILAGNNKLANENNKLPVITLDYEAVDTINQVSCKGNAIDDNMLNALITTTQAFSSIRELKFEFCKLSCQNISDIQYLLKQFPSITLLSVNGNPNEYQNYYVLLMETNLRILSIQFCNMDEIGARPLSKVLKRNCTLVYLNLASNCLGDEGADLLGKVFRGNRCLAALNISDNQITSRGFVKFFEPFQKFALEHKEIVFRRHENMSYLKRKEEMIADLKKKLYAKTSINGKENNGLSRKRSSSTTSSYKKMELEYEQELVRSTHPFVCESSPANMQIFCTGNNTLLHLNISYNEISSEVVQIMNDVVRYQKRKFGQMPKTKTGLSRVIMEVSDNGKISNAVEEFYYALYSKEARVKSKSGGSLPGSKRSSVVHL